MLLGSESYFQLMDEPGEICTRQWSQSFEAQLPKNQAIFGTFLRQTRFLRVVYPHKDCSTSVFSRQESIQNKYHRAPLGWLYANLDLSNISALIKQIQRCTEQAGQMHN